MSTYFESTQLPVFAAEFDYFRIAPERRHLLLARLAQLGVNAVTLTVPWNFHQLDEQTVDFSGATNPRRNLLAVLNLCAELQLPCVLKPGPFCQNNGILNDGLPHWLAGLTAADKPLYAAAQIWFDGLTRAVRQMAWPNGPIIALSLDFGATGSSPALSRQLTEVNWPIWLRKRYPDVAALNAAYGSNYRSISEVEFPQPEPGDDSDSPQQADAQEFLRRVQQATHNRYRQMLADAGWQTPIYPLDPEQAGDLPALVEQSLPDFAGWAEPFAPDVFYNLRQPLQINVNPPDVGSAPTWAGRAPIRADGWLRRSFWAIRQQLWQHRLSATGATGDAPCVIPIPQGGIITAARDVPAKIPLETGHKPVAFRLAACGELTIAPNFKAARGRLSGPFVTEDEQGQTDFVLYLADPKLPLDGFAADYLRRLLAAQTSALSDVAANLRELATALSPRSQAAPSPKKPARTPFAIAEARRGLSNAEAALQKAAAAIGGLDAGFETILGDERQALTPAQADADYISPDLFRGAARETARRVADRCQKIAAGLEAAAAKLRAAETNPLTTDSYREQYQSAVSAAQSGGESLLEIVSEFRQAIAAGELPRLTWRVHHRVQSLASQLRRGVLRR